MKILIAEDRQPLREAIRFLMEDWGYEADIVGNGPEAVGKAAGWEAALTANFHFRGKRKTGTEFDDYIEKPFDCSALHEKIIDLTVKSVEIEKSIRMSPFGGRKNDFEISARKK